MCSGSYKKQKCVAARMSHKDQRPASAPPTERACKKQRHEPSPVPGSDTESECAHALAELGILPPGYCRFVWHDSGPQTSELWDWIIIESLTNLHIETPPAHAR